MMQKGDRKQKKKLMNKFAEIKLGKSCKIFDT